ncbi:MAG: SprT family zinc-dependent metalloprotease [Rikenellaceae bacterium]
MEQIRINDIVIHVIRKDIKSVNIRIYPPNGEVRVTASRFISFKRIEAFVLSKSEWIIKRHREITAQEITTPEYQDGDTIYYLGGKLTLRIIEGEYQTHCQISESQELTLYIKPNSTLKSRQAAINNWYSAELKSIFLQFIPKWENILEVKTNQITIRDVKSKWGSCNVISAKIMFNLQLIRRPIESIEYIVVHELAHLRIRGHNAQFYALVDSVLPSRRTAEKELKQRY